MGDLQYSLDQELVTEAKTLLNNTSKKSITSKASRLPLKNLKFCGDGYKENKVPL